MTEPAATIHSPAFTGVVPRCSVVVATFGRSAMLPGLLQALEAQTLAVQDFEVVVVDNGSCDATWSTLGELARSTSLALVAVRLGENRGPAGGRNAGLAFCRAPLVAFTDDDCLPAPGWLTALLATSDAGADVVQGCTEPDPSAPAWPEPWARTMWIREPSWLFETCNLAYRREVLDAIGGFDEHDELTARASGRAFGEDVVLGWRAIEGGARFAFAPDALVHHRWMSSDFRRHLAELRQLRHFPVLARRHPGMARGFFCGRFLSRRTAAFDLALTGAVVAVAARGPWRLAGAAVSVPWLREALSRARVRPGRPLPLRLAQLAVGDAVALSSLLAGSLRARRLLL